jgi:two-component system sensor histidine kinase AlgZ
VRGALFTTTWQALAAPRRLVPIVLVAAALILVQLAYSPDDPRAGLVPLVMTIGFVALGPVGWRVHWALHLAAALLVVGAGGVLLPRVLGLGPTFLTDVGSLSVAAVLYLAGGWGLGRDLELEHDLERSQLHAMRAHLDPHFLYNTLNALAEWCRQDATQAEEGIVRLSAMLEGVFAGLELRRWPLERELAVVADLVALHRVRDPGALTLEQRIDGPTDGIEVPPLALLLLGENAIKHGPQKGHRGTLTLTVRVATTVQIVLENPGSYRPVSDGRGRGLTLLRRQLDAAYGRGRARVVLAGEGARTRATLTLPRSRPL